MPSITIVGLGPGDPGALTQAALDVLAAASELYLRTRRHPTVAALPAHLTLHDLDAIYECELDFGSVYAAMARDIVQLGARPEGVIYAVPGHPLIGEESVRRILVAAREHTIPVRIVEGLSFVDAVCTTLGLDPLDRGLQLTDATLLAAREGPFVPPLTLDPGTPLLIAQLYNRTLASAVKLVLMELYPDDHAVTLVQAAGTVHQRVHTAPLYELDHDSSVEHLATLYVPPVPPLTDLRAFSELQGIVARLRAPDGCPWDRQQTHQTLAPHLLEETYETLAALDTDDPDKLCEELGDLLLQILLHAQIANEVGEFTWPDVVAGIAAKLVRRHPHVFGQVAVQGADEVLVNWEAIKRRERAEQESHASMLDGVPPAMPALAYAQTIQRRVARVGFDWPDITGAWDKLAEELRELRTASVAERAHELGDVLFAVVNLARWLDVEAEDALRQANTRFRQRFAYIEHTCAEQDVLPEDLSLEELDAIWEQSKRRAPV
ncbi:MAG: nucleoside triphosphate pyrophosphohydrolase [Chloroflexi bacterium]|nr:nucleoside triphosphate pyrophosphohydrolase [Chloroflexota bacterium]MBU1749801.1 nucleoside triphosphate pyrophosphohydrolase [Chloroflexota bacterium]